jgi:flagellar hook-length control protein FliK
MTTLAALPPSPVPAGAAPGTPAGSGPGGSDGGAFAGLLVAGAAAAAPASEPVVTEDVPADGDVAPHGEETVDGAAFPPVVEPSAAQIIVAAQVTPLGPMLANAPRLTPSYADPADAASSPTTGSVPASESALLVGDLGQSLAGVPDAGGRGVAASIPGTEPVTADGVPGGGFGDSTGVQGRGSDDPAVGGQSGSLTSEQPGTGHQGAGQQGSGHQGAGQQGGGQQGAGQQGAGLTAGTQPGAPSQDVQAAGAHPIDRQPADSQQGGAPATTQRTETQATGTQPTVAQTSAVPGVTGTGPATTTATTASASTAAANPVAGQVFPEVTRLVSRGDGTRRITLQLSPEALGDVRVVLTVRNGEVQVRMSGGEQAQQALLAGAPELHKLLDLAGATSSQIQVGSQSSTQDQSLDRSLDRSLDQALDQHTRQHAQDGELQQDHQSHRTAGTRDGDTSARDGAPRGTHSHPATNPGTRTRITGVDVTM